MNIEKTKMFKVIGENIKNVREEKGKSLEEVSLKTGIRKQYLEKIEQGKAYRVNITKIFMIAETLQVEPHILFKGV